MTQGDAAASSTTGTASLHDRAGVQAAIAAACARVAPLWPLAHFVAVNPFLGFMDRSFQAACAMMYRIARVDLLMPRGFYLEAVHRGVVRDEDLARACQEAPAGWRVPGCAADLVAALERPITERVRHPAHVPSVAEVLDSLAGGDRIASGTAFMVDEVSKWCAAYFDEGQSSWRLPVRRLAPYPAWRQSVRYDRNAEVMGIRAFRSIIGALPEDPVDAVAKVVLRQGVPARATADYLHQALVDVIGWASYARYLAWDAERQGRTDDTLVHLLAIRLAWGYALFVQHARDEAFLAAWHGAMKQAAVPALDDLMGEDPDLSIDLLAHEAYEHAYRRSLFERLAARPAARAPAERPAIQAAFCIDVRSEVFRRALEAASEEVETLGYAGFFGFPIEYVPLGHLHGGAQCPVILRPAFTVCETVRGMTPAEEARILRLRLLRQRVAKAWKSFKTAAVSSFTFVEAAGLLFAPKIVSDSLALTRPVHDPNVDGIDPSVVHRLGPRVEPGELDGRPTGFRPGERADWAERVLRGLSLTSRFARLVLLAGHGSTTVNNPYASSLDCGACGGYTGEANARVAAAALNDPEVREELARRGIAIPEDTWFLGCLHDTTLDQVKVHDADAVPADLAADLALATALLQRAGASARRERAGRLGIRPDEPVDRRIQARSRDWSEVRPEWGNAGNAALIAAPRSRTRGVDLSGRVFLHEYDWRRDEGFQVLELILTAPVVVATWINLQYYGSTVNPRVFGSGNKVLHNVAGIIGVFEGNGGDLKVGLPWQSVHDGDRYVHEPLRLTVVLEAPREAIEGVIARHEDVRNLVENRWIHLFAMEDGVVTHRYAGTGAWEAVDGA